MAELNTITNAPLRLEVHDNPTYFNKEAAIGFFLFPVVGSIIGAIIGKNRMRHELEHGREIREPTMFNKDMVLGALLVPAATFVVSTVASIAIPPLTPFAAIATLAATPVGLIYGGFKGKAAMENDKKEAIGQLQNYALSQHYSQSRRQMPEFEHDLATGKNHAAQIEAERAQYVGAHR